MFQKTKTPETTLFESPSNLLRGRALKKYDNPKAWQNQFYELVTSNIDEDVFKPLFKDGNMSRSNASISQLVAIMVMKEGSRSSDEQMFEAVDYDLLVRKALGLVNLSNQAPSLDTYYLLRRRMASYEDETGINLLEHCFKDVTKAQCVKFKVKGESVRMDSKLIGRNIARYSRYRIILSTLQQWAKASGLGKLNPSLRKKVQPYMDEDAQKTEYCSTSDEIQKRIEAIPKKELDRRNNVEAAMFHISYHTRNNKTRYRGLGKHLMWACARRMWMNFIRLLVFQTTACQRTLFALLWAIWRPLQGHLSQVRESLLNLLYIFIGGQQRRLEPQIILAG